MDQILLPHRYYQSFHLCPRQYSSFLKLSLKQLPTPPGVNLTLIIGTRGIQGITDPLKGDLSSCGGDLENTATELGLCSLSNLTVFGGKVYHLLGTIPRNLPLDSRSQTQQQNHLFIHCWCYSPCLWITLPLALNQWLPEQEAQHPVLHCCMASLWRWLQKAAPAQWSEAAAALLSLAVYLTSLLWPGRFEEMNEAWVHRWHCVHTREERQHVLRLWVDPHSLQRWAHRSTQL